MIKTYPVPAEAFCKEQAPYVYAKLAEEFSKIRPNLEPRTDETIACFGGEPLRSGITARAWLEAGYIIERD